MFAQSDQFYDDDDFVVAEHELLEESLLNARLFAWKRVGTSEKASIVAFL